MGPIERLRQQQNKEYFGSRATPGLSKYVQDSYGIDYGAILERKKQEEIEAKKRKAAEEFKESFYKQTDNSNAFFGIASGLRRRAEAGDEEAQYKYKAIFDDERAKAFMQPDIRTAGGGGGGGGWGAEVTPGKDTMNAAKQRVPGDPRGTGGMTFNAPVNSTRQEGFKNVYSPGPQLSNMEKAGVMGAGFVQAIAQPYVRGGRFLERRISQNRDTQVSEKQTQLIDTLGEQVKMLRGIISSDTTSPARRKKAQEELNKVMNEMGTIVGTQRANAEDFQNWGDGKRVLGSVGEMGLDLATAGLLRGASKLPAGSRALRTFGTGVVGGTGIGATTAIQDDTDIMQGATNGLLLGSTLGAFGAAAPSINKALRGAPGKGVKVTKTYTKGGESLSDVVVNGKTTKGVDQDTVAALMNYKTGGLASKMSNPVRKLESKIAPWVGENVSRPVRRKVNKIPGAEKVINTAGAVFDEINQVKIPYRGKLDRAGQKITEVMDQLSTAINKSNSVALHKMTTNPDFDTLVKILQAPKGKKAQQALMEDLGKFVSKKQDIITHNKLVATGAKAGKIKKVPVGTKVQQQYYEAMNRMTKSPITTLYEAGRIDKYTYDKWMADDNYTRVQREIDEQFGEISIAGESNAINRGGNVEMKLGADQSQEAIEPLAALMDFYMRTESSLAKKEFAKYLKEVGQQHKVIGKAKVSSANVKIRKEALGAMLQNSAFKKTMTRFLKSQNKHIRKIKLELDRLNKEGLNKSLQKKKKGMPDFVPEGMGGKSATSQTGKVTTDYVSIIDGKVVKEPAKEITRLGRLRDKLLKQAKELDPPKKVPRSKTVKGAKTAKEASSLLKKARLAQEAADPEKAAKLRKRVDEIKKEIKKLNEGTVKATDANVVSSKLSEADTKRFLNDLIEMDSTEFNNIVKKIGSREKKLAQALEEIAVIRKDIEISSDFNKAMRETIQKHADLDHKGKPMLKVWNDGVQELYEIDINTYRQLNGMSNKVMQGWQRNAMQANRILRFGATAGNPSFAAANVVRDFFTSAIHTDDIFATHNPATVGRSLKETIAKPIGRTTIGRWAKDDNFIHKMLQPSKEFQQFMIKNQNITRADLGKQLDSTIQEVQKIMGIKRESPLQTWENVVSGSEMFGRYQNFSGTLRKEIAKGDGSVASFSKALAEANRASAKNSINFANKSEYANAIKIMNPYLNAGIQGSRQLGRTLLDKPITATFKIATGVIAPVMASTYYNLADPERAEVYASMLATNPAEVENNLIFVKGDGNVIKLPLPPGINKFANPFRNFIESQYVGDQQGFKDSAVDFLGAFNPFGDSQSQGVATILPQPVIPVVEDVTNHSFFYNDNIIPENMEWTPEEEQYYNSIPQSIRDIANILNISPIKAQHYIRGYTAGVGTGVFGTADKLLGRESGSQSFDDQVLRRFYKPEANKGVSNTYYDGNRDTKGKDELDGVKEYTTKSLTQLVGQGKIDEANKKAAGFNAEVDRAIDALKNKYGRYDSTTYENGDSIKDVRLGLLEAMKFPVKDGKLTEGSINSRKKIYDERN